MARYSYNRPPRASSLTQRLLQLALLSSLALTTSARPIYRELFSSERQHISSSLLLRQRQYSAESGYQTTTTKSNDKTIAIIAAVLSILLVSLVLLTIFIYIRYYRPRNSSKADRDPEKYPIPAPDRPPEIRVRRLKRFQNGNKVVLHPRTDRGELPPSTPRSPTPSHRRNVQVMRDNMISIEPPVPRPSSGGWPRSTGSSFLPPPHPAARSSMAARKPHSARENKVVRFPSQMQSGGGTERRRPGTPVGANVEYYGYERRSEDQPRVGVSPMAPRPLNSASGPEKLVQHKRAPSWL